MNIDEFNSLINKANDGDVECQEQIGEMYYYGAPLEVKKDLNKAMKWYFKAAENGNVKSQLILGNAYYDGFGVERDLKQAIFWWREAEKNGNVYAVKKLERIKDI